jgi:TAP-like protein
VPDRSWGQAMEVVRRSSEGARPDGESGVPESAGTVPSIRRLEAARSGTGMRPRADAELAVGAPEVCLDRLLAHHERCRDLAVREPARGEPRDTLLCRSQVVGGGWAKAETVELSPHAGRPDRGSRRLQDRQGFFKRHLRRAPLAQAASKTSRLRARSNGIACTDWPVADDRYAGPWAVRTAAPVLVVGNHFDGVTDYAGAVATSQLLKNSRLLIGVGPPGRRPHASGLVGGRKAVCRLTGRPAWKQGGAAAAAPSLICAYLRPPPLVSKSMVCGFRWSIVCDLPGFGKIVRYATMPSERPLLVTPSVA